VSAEQSILYLCFVEEHMWSWAIKIDAVYDFGKGTYRRATYSTVRGNGHRS